MRALAAIFILVVWPCCARADRDYIPRAVYTVLGITKQHPVHRLITCGQTLGPSKCLSALSVWRAENAVETFSKEKENAFNLTAEVESFPWENYINNSNEHLYTQLCENTEGLLRYRPLELTLISGYKLQLGSNGNGKLNVDIYKTDNEEATGRSTMKKLQKQFYNILPILILPGLIMSAILPFVLPALKMMTVAVGMLNNMALSGAVFTLLRNNAFSDRYEKKVIYVNEGYRNEKLKHDHRDSHHDHFETDYSPTHEDVIEDPGTGGDYDTPHNYPNDIVKQYYEG